MSLVSSLRIVDLIGGDNAIAWIDTQGFVHKLTDGDAVLLPSSILLNDGSRPMLDTYVPAGAHDIATKDYVDTHGGSQTPWTSDIDAAGFSLLNANNVVSGSFQASGGATFHDSQIDSSDSSSVFYLTADSNFGIYNSNAFGSGGENINLVSQNGSINLSANSHPAFFDGSTGFFGIGTATPSYFLHVEGDGSTTGSGFYDILFKNTDTSSAAANQARIRLTTDGDLLDGVLFLKTVNSGPYGGFAAFWNEENTDFAFATNNTERMRVTSTGLLTVGSSSDDGTGALIQSAGDISATGYLYGHQQTHTDPMSSTVNVGAYDYYVDCQLATTVNLPTPTHEGKTIWLYLGDTVREVIINDDSSSTIFDINVVGDANYPSTLVLVWNGSIWQTMLRNKLEDV